MKKLPALTLIELIVTIGIISIVSIPTFIAIGNFRARHTLNASSEVFVNTLKQARIYARESKDGAEWGVRRLDQNSYALISKNLTGVKTVSEYENQDPVIFETPSFEIWFVQGSGTLKNGVPISVVMKANSANAYVKQVNVNGVGLIETQ